MKQDEVEIFWAPAFEIGNLIDWNILYYDLESLYDHLRPRKNNNTPNQNFFYCPAFADLAKSTFVIKNPLLSHYRIENSKEVVPLSKNYISSTIFHPPSIDNCPLMIYGLKWIFFTEDEIDMTITSPYFSNSPHMRYASIVPARMKIDSWFRAVNLEYNIWSEDSEFKVEQDEIMAYISFNTDKKIKLTRFEMNEKLHSYSNVGIQSSVWESWVPLKKRYERFKKTRMHELILKEIKRNII